MEEYLKRVADEASVAVEVERLYDGIRGIIIHDSTMVSEVGNILSQNVNMLYNTIQV